MAFALDRLIDRLIIQPAARNDATLKQARFQRYLILTTLLLSCVYTWCLWAIDYPVGVRVLLGFVTTHVLLVGLMWRGVPSWVVGHLYCAMAVTGYLVLCLSTYGVASATIVWFVCPMVSSYWLIGRRAGYFWSGVSIASVLVLFGAGALGWQFPLGFPARYYYIYSGIAFVGALLFVVVVVVTYENWQKAALSLAERLAHELQVQKQVAESQRDQTAQALAELRTTQQQLIQKEKMASLGELTAGIAHEIQNPLNFVNNFSELTLELLAELEAEQTQPAPDLDLAASLHHDLRQNLERIHQHGQRAAAIVRGMLGHSRTSTAERRPTSLNALGEEFFRLAYHGLRAKDPAFQATLEADLDPALPLIEAVGPDLGRVLLNLLTNAFYAVHQRQRAGEPCYVPTVRLQTSATPEAVLVQVHDNGIGIPAAVQAKIFQPFFTTKPTGEGTGLGLSLAHDIVVQGHGGTLTLSSQEGVGTTFLVRLPRPATPRPQPVAAAAGEVP